MKKLFAGLLVFLLMLGTVSCSENGTENSETVDTPKVSAADENAETEPSPEETEITRENTPDSLPDNLDFDGKSVTIYYSNGFNWTEFIEGGEELTGEVVSDTVFTSNQSVMERLNIDLEYYAENSGDYSTINSLVSNLIMANDSTYDVYLGEQYGLVQTAVKGYYRNVFELPYLDFERPWWNVTFMENLQLTDDYRMFMTGDFNLTTMNQLFVQYFNKRIYTDLYGNPDDLYSSVLEGTWTIDKMSELIASSYIDTNGNGSVDSSDQLGYVAYMTYSTVDPFMYCADVPYTSRNEEGRIVIDMNQERAVTLTEKTVNLFKRKANEF